MRFAREAWPFVLPTALVAALLSATGLVLAAAVAAIAALKLLLFFRIPARRPPADARAVLAPANGRVLSVERVSEPALGDGTWQRVAVFLSVFDVHVQRAPVAGEVVSSSASPGRRKAAFAADAAEVNASHLTVLRGASGELFGVRQIVGLVARRIVCYLAPGDRIDRGELMGVIKFGSRVDLLLPDDFEVRVAPGERTVEGQTVVATPPPSETEVTG